MFYCTRTPRRTELNSQIGGFEVVAYHSIASDLLEMTDLLLYGPETTFSKLRFQRSFDLDHKRRLRRSEFPRRAPQVMPRLANRSKRSLVRERDYTGVDPQLRSEPHDECQFVPMVIPCNLPTTERWKINSGHHEGMFFIVCPAIIRPAED